MTDLEALVVAAYVFADEYPVPARGGRRPLISDAELVALAVAQAAIGDQLRPGQASVTSVPRCSNSFGLRLGSFARVDSAYSRYPAFATSLGSRRSGHRRVSSEKDLHRRRSRS
jgi:hypothetical protein